MVQDLKVGGLAVEQKLNMCLQNSICFADTCFVSGEGKESLQKKITCLGLRTEIT